MDKKVMQAYDQKRTGKAGRFGKRNPCYGCGKSAGDNYFSHPLTDSKSPLGEDWGDTALCLCHSCAVATEHMTEPRQFEIWAAKKNLQNHVERYHWEGRGGCPVCADIAKEAK